MLAETVKHSDRKIGRQTCKLGGKHRERVEEEKRVERRDSSTTKPHQWQYCLSLCFFQLFSLSSWSCLLARSLAVSLLAVWCGRANTTQIKADRKKAANKKLKAGLYASQLRLRRRQAANERASARKQPSYDDQRTTTRTSRDQWALNIDSNTNIDRHRNVERSRSRNWNWNWNWKRNKEKSTTTTTVIVENTLQLRILRRWKASAATITSITQAQDRKRCHLREEKRGRKNYLPFVNKLQVWALVKIFSQPAKGIRIEPIEAA